MKYATMLDVTPNSLVCPAGPGAGEHPLSAVVRRRDLRFRLDGVAEADYSGYSVSGELK
jgi:hypothetical protein